MNLKDRSGPAFPFVVQDVSKCQVHESGMTLREYIATHALAAMLVDTDNLNKYEAERAAKAVAHADALMAELAK